MLFVISFFLSWLAAKKEAWLWLVLPFSFFFDFWYQTPLGFSGMKMLLVFLIFWWTIGRGHRESSRIKV